MKVFIILLLVALATTVGYLVGTDSGRQRSDEIIARIRKATDKTTDAVKEAATDAGEAVAEAAEKLGA